MTSSGLKLNNAELWGGVIWLVLGLFIIDRGLTLEIGTVNAPGMGFAMFWIGLLMCGLAARIVIGSLIDEGASVASLWQGTRWIKTLIVIGCLLVYSLTFSMLGFLLTTIPLMLILLRVIDPVRWELALPLGVGMPLLVWWLLQRLLSIQLPSGIFEIG